MSTPAWSTQQLAEFLEIFGALERGSILQVAVDRVAESLDAEVTALIHGTDIMCCRGFPPDRIPVAELLELRDQRPAEATVNGLGPAHVLVAHVDATTQTSLLVLRCDPAFNREESTLLRSMGRALSLALDNRDLLTQLGERQDLATRLFRIQQSISHRAPLQQVLDAVTDGAAELLGADIVGVHVYPGAVDGEQVASMAGVGERHRAAFAATPIDAGFTGRAFVENQLVTTDDYQSEAGRVDVTGSFATHAAMAAPVHRDGVPVGVISVATLDPDRRFTPAEADVLLTFAQHVSLAVNDANAVHQMRRSLEGATYLASHDSLTGMANRSAIIDVLDRALARAAVDHPVAVLFIDVDRFKSVNDVLGHAVGDQVLVEISQRLTSAVRTTDVVARLGGDEFVIVAHGITVTDAEELAERINLLVARPLDVGYRDIVLTVSVGIAVATYAMSADDLLADADVAMYRAKQRGRSRVVHFDHEMRVEMLRRSDLERDLTAALRHGGELEVHYQPTMRLSTGHIEGFEALVRWRHPTRGLLGADDFIPLAEDTGQITAIDRHVLHRATRQLAEWQAIDPTFSRLTMAVNLSARQFADPALVSLVDFAMHAAELPADTLWLEITETIMMDQTGSTLTTLAALRQLGVRLSIDDFGTGYSSLVYLKRFPVDALKIDRAFVAGLGVDRDDEAIVTAVVRLAEALGLTAVAEGVEDERQLEWLNRLECPMAQGYFFARPTTADGAEQLLRSQLARSERVFDTI